MQYTIMTEEDLDEFIAFLKKNQYYLLKLDSEMTKEEFIDVQKKRGFLFSVVTKQEGKIVAHIAAYQGGGQKICKPHQVFLSTMIIDKEYRNAMYSIPVMYFYMMQRLQELGYTDILCECGEENMTSLRMIRQFGGIMLDSKIEMYHNYLLHNYLLGISYLSGPELIKTMKEDISFLPVIKRQFAVQEYPVEQGRYVWQDFYFKEDEVSVCINIHSGYVCGLKIEKMFSIIPVDSNYEITYYPCGKKEVELITWKENNQVSKQLLNTDKEEQIKISIDGSFDKIQWINHNNEMNFFLYPNKDIEACEASWEEWKKDLWFEKSSGKLRFSQGEEMRLCEMLPGFTYPYNIGYLQPEEKRLKVEQKDDSYIVTNQTDSYIMKRTYQIEESRVKISTHIMLLEDILLDPIYNVFMEDLSYQCEIHLQNGESVEKEFNFARDNATGNEEVIFMDFRREAYSKQEVSYILLRYGSLELKVEMQKPCRCFHQYNYIGIIPEADWNEEKARCLETGEFIDIGDIYISRV